MNMVERQNPNEKLVRDLEASVPMQPLHELSQLSSSSQGFDPSRFQLLRRYVTDHICEPGRRDFVRPVVHEWVQYTILLVFVLWLPGIFKTAVSRRLNSSPLQPQMPGFCSLSAAGHMLLGFLQMLLIMPPTHWIRFWRKSRQACRSEELCEVSAEVQALQDLNILHRWSQIQALAFFLCLVGFHAYDLVKRISFLSSQFFHSSYFRNESDFALGALLGCITTLFVVPALQLMCARRTRRRRVCADEYFPVWLAFCTSGALLLCMYTAAGILFVRTIQSKPIDPSAPHH